MIYILLAVYLGIGYYAANRWITGHPKSAKFSPKANAIAFLVVSLTWPIFVVGHLVEAIFS